MKSFLNTCNLFWSADFKGNSCVMIYHDINCNVYTFTDPMPEKIFGSLRLVKNSKNFFWLASLAMGAQITDLD